MNGLDGVNLGMVGLILHVMLFGNFSEITSPIWRWVFVLDVTREVGMLYQNG